MAHPINNLLNRLEKRKAVNCNSDCEYWEFPHLQCACVLSKVFSVDKGEPCFEFKTKEEKYRKMMTKKYRLMIYFVMATIDIYSKTIVENKLMSVEQFREANSYIVQRVFDEGLSIFNYKLSDHQLSRGIAAYLSAKFNPSDVNTIYESSEER